MVSNLGPTADLVLMKQLFFYTWIVVGLTGCPSATNSEAERKLTRAQEIYTEAMEVHDEVMPHMEEIMQLRQRLQVRIDSLRGVDSIGYADTLRQMENTVQHLRQADEAMMQWMRGVQRVPALEDPQTEYQEEMEFQTADTTAVIKTQLEQMEAIKTVKEQMEASIDEARRLVGSLE